MKVTIKGILKENKMDQLIDKVVSYMIDETEYGFLDDEDTGRRSPFLKNRIYIKYPFEKEFGYFLYESHNALPTLKRKKCTIENINYLIEEYGLRSDENIFKLGDIIFERYYSTLHDIVEDLLNSRDLINESVDNKKERTIEKIVQYMIDETKFEVGKDTIMGKPTIWIKYPPYENYAQYELEKLLPLLIQRREKFSRLDRNDWWINQERKYIEDKFGITNWYISTRITERYLSELYNMFEGMYDELKNQSLNESHNPNMDRLIDKVTMSLLNDTTFRVNYENSLKDVTVETDLPMYPEEPFVDYFEDIVKLYDEYRNENTIFRLGRRDIPYMEHNYGISDEDTIKKIYREYFKLLYTKIYKEILNNFNTHKPMNESHVNNIDRFVDRVSQSLFNDTKYEVFRYRNEIRSKILYPFYPNVIRNNNEDHYRTFLKIIRVHGWEYGMTDEEYRYMRDTYDITDTNTILNIFLKYYILLYTNILEEMDKIRNNPLNNFK